PRRSPPRRPRTGTRRSPRGAPRASFFLIADRATRARCIGELRAPLACLLARRSQLVAGTAKRLERKRVAELRAQAPHVNVDGARSAFVTRAPYPREQHFAREDAPAVRHQKREQRKFFRRQDDAPSFERH